MEQFKNIYRTKDANIKKVSLIQKWFCSVFFLPQEQQDREREREREMKQKKASHEYLSIFSSFHWGSRVCSFVPQCRTFHLNIQLHVRETGSVNVKEVKLRELQNKKLQSPRNPNWSLVSCRRQKWINHHWRWWHFRPVHESVWQQRSREYLRHLERHEKAFFVFFFFDD